MRDGNLPSAKDAARTKRDKRLADALRANLRRRKSAGHLPAPGEEGILPQESGGAGPTSDDKDR